MARLVRGSVQLAHTESVPFLFVLLSLVAGAFIGWLSVLAGIWFTLPIFLICAAIVSTSLGREFRWRLAAFSVGVFVVLGFYVNTFVRDNFEDQQKAQSRMEKERLQKRK
ncbi:hypothetical protein IAD21_04988 [Abditibacteriota bacterium]|nr:hypothetical protein IAD21_04988 [Abditibacteriota bacterium]